MISKSFLEISKIVEIKTIEENLLREQKKLLELKLNSFKQDDSQIKNHLFKKTRKTIAQLEFQKSRLLKNVN